MGGRAPYIFPVIHFLHICRSALTLTEAEFTERAGRSLVNTFPFNSADTSLPSRVDRQGGNDVDVDFASVAAAGKRCIDKVEMVEETEYDEEVKLLNLSLHPPLSSPGAV